MVLSLCCRCIALRFVVLYVSLSYVSRCVVYPEVMGDVLFIKYPWQWKFMQE